ncbi:hypothetical protein SAMN05421846_111139 [Chryseobacterium taeanense]|uniref:Uncharacterized protein n=1 Tax=Chryseobacterium taeanense TaxID=311334 RepID=A0A1G8MHL7_9FLAO|nr:hypothetical protein SAMN05421846_111139 [Chryseobacterium taeanense]
MMPVLNAKFVPGKIRNYELSHKKMGKTRRSES